MRVLIGKWHNGEAVNMDRDLLITSRMLVCANSGGGKSYMLRGLLEMHSNNAQQIILDTEGEFSSLRERFDFVICSTKGGDALVHPKTAALLARRLMETKVSAVVDISDLKVPDRHEFVKRFIGELMVLPRELWSPALIYLDEAHLYCPEKGMGESVASDAVIDLASRGRKRGLCLIAATQRLAKFRKDTAAELLNRLIGRTGLDIDVRRAAFDLGMAPKDAQRLLPHLDPGQFYAYGPAISKVVRLMSGISVRTSHPLPGVVRTKDLPKPTPAVMAVLPQLADLQKEAEAELVTLQDHKQQIAKLQQELRNATRGQKKTGDVTSPAQTEALKILRTRVRQLEASNKALVKLAGEGHKWMHRLAADMQTFAEMAADSSSRYRAFMDPKLAKLLSEAEDGIALVSTAPPEHEAVLPAGRPMQPPRQRTEPTGNLKPSQQAILNALAWLAEKGIEPAGKNPVAAVAGVSPNSSGYANNLGALRTAGLIEYPSGGMVMLTESGRAVAVLEDTGKSVFDSWMGLSAINGKQKDILQTLHDVHPQALSKEELAEGAQASPTSSGFANNLGSLRSLGCIDYPRPGMVALTKNVVP